MTDMTTMNRETDVSQLKITRGVPSWAVIVTVVTWIFTAGGLYTGIQEQTKATAKLEGAVVALASQVASKDVKDAQHDARLDEHERRISEANLRITNMELKR